MSAHTLYLVRHGATEANGEGRYIGWEEHPLSPEGLAQARRVAEHLRTRPLTSLHSSDLVRAVQTAQAIQQATGLPLQVDAGLREVHFGRWSGLTYGEIRARSPRRLQAWLDNPEAIAPPGGETLAALRSRALTALPKGDGAVVVTHGGVIRALLAHLTGRPFWDFQPPPGSVTTLRWDGERCLGASCGTIVPGQDGSAG